MENLSTGGKFRIFSIIGEEQSYFYNAPYYSSYHFQPNDCWPVGKTGVTCRDIDFGADAALVIQECFPIWLRQARCQQLGQIE